MGNLIHKCKKPASLPDYQVKQETKAIVKQENPSDVLMKDLYAQLSKLVIPLILGTLKNKGSHKFGKKGMRSKKGRRSNKSKK